MLLKFLYHVDMVITRATTMTGRFPTIFIKVLLAMYSYWTHNDLHPNDPLADNKLTLLDRADTVHGWLKVRDPTPK